MIQFTVRHDLSGVARVGRRLRAASGAGRAKLAARLAPELAR
jgi:hypothetical protein